MNILNNTQQFNKEYNYLFKDLGISESSVTSILEDSDGDIWVGTKYNGVVNFRIETNEPIRYIYDETMEQSLSSNTINYLCEVAKGIILVATNEYMDLIFKESSHIENIKENDIGLESAKNIIKVYSDGTYTWTGSNYGFYSNLQGINLSTNYNNHFYEKGLNSYKIVDVFPDERDENILWLAGTRYTGLIKFHKLEGILNIYNSNDINSNLTYDTINCIQVDGSGDLWIGTSAGLNKFNIETEVFTNYSEKDGLANGYINSILIDDEGDL